uniref:Uncharacterized protein n=1 Tax=Chenopodium quinoa TaxID=63459 RepID=A0A803KQ20_CHEQI
MHLHEDHSALDSPAPAKSEARSKVVQQFGVWMGEGSEMEILVQQCNVLCNCLSISMYRTVSKDICKPSKFDSWESGENCSVYLDNAGKEKNNNRRMLNPDDPKADPKEHQSKVLQFGASDNRDKVAGCIIKFENKQKVNKRELTMFKKEPQIKGDMHVQLNPLAQGLARAKSANDCIARFPLLDEDCTAERVRSLDRADDFIARFPLLDEDCIFERVWPLARADDCTARFPLVDKDCISERAQPLARPDDCIARFPLLDEDCIAERVQPLARADDPWDYRKGRRLAVEQSDIRVVGQIGIASQGFPISMAESESPLWKKSGLMQPNVGETSSTVQEIEDQMNQDIHPLAQAYSPPATPEERPNMPQFGAWDGGGDVGHSQNFVNVINNYNKGRTFIPEPYSDAPQLNREESNNEFLMNGDMRLHDNPSVLVRPASAKSQSKVPQLGVREREGEAGYKRCFGYVWKNNKNKHMVTSKPSDAFQLNSDDCIPSDKVGHSMRHYIARRRCRSGGRRFACSDEEFREPINNARFPILDEDWIAERVHRLPRANDQLVYGGSRRFKGEPRGGNENDVGLLVTLEIHLGTSQLPRMDLILLSGRKTNSNSFGIHSIKKALLSLRKKHRPFQETSRSLPASRMQS